MGERDATQMGADPDHDQPLVVARLDARLVRPAGRADWFVSTAPASSISFWVRWLMKIGWRARTLDDLPGGDRAEIDFHRGTGRDR